MGPLPPLVQQWLRPWWCGFVDGSYLREEREREREREKKEERERESEKIKKEYLNEVVKKIKLLMLNIL